ncbi:MAG TPA: flippase [Dissulfurispiraceae bacterium]|nr:flippase [Dissulfurispiraceae bacterium]
MSKINSIRKSVFFNVGGYVISVLVAFLITPITIHTLGDTRYGAWALVAQLIGYYGLLDLGIRGAVTYFVARHSALNQQEEIKEILSSAFWLLSACGFVALLVGVGFTVGFPYLFRTEALDLAEVQQSLLIMTILVAFSLPMNAFCGGLVGKQRFDVVSGVEIVNRIITGIFTYIVLKAGGGLVALALVQAGGRVISWGMTLAACRMILGGVFARPVWFKKHRVRSLAAYGFQNALGNVAMMAIYRLDIVVVAMFAGIDRVVFYSIASTLVLYASSLCSSIAFVFTPRFAQLDSRCADDELQKLYLFGTRVTGMVVTGLVAGILVFGEDFIKLWLGASYVSGHFTDRSDILLTVLILASLPHMLQGISRQRLYGTGHVRFLMWLNICEATANLGLSILLVRHYGPLGVALGTLFPILISQVLIMPVYSSRVFKIPLWQLLSKGFAKPVIVGILMVIINMACIFIAAPNTWLVFFCNVFVAVILGGLVCVGIGLSREERQEYLVRFLRRPKAHVS